MADRTMVDYTRKIKPYFEGVAPIEPTTTAASAHSVGDMFYLDGVLVEATSAISINDPIIVSPTASYNVKTVDAVVEQIKDVVSDVSTLDSSLATVAKSGSYNDLLNTPTVDTTPTSASTDLVSSGGVFSFAVSGVTADTSSTDGQVGVSVAKAGLSNTITPSVCGWDKLVGKWSTAVLAAVGATSVIVSNPQGVTTVTIDPFCENSSGTPIAITSYTVTTSTITLNFSALTEATSFKCKVTVNS